MQSNTILNRRGTDILNALIDNKRILGTRVTHSLTHQNDTYQPVPLDGAAHWADLQWQVVLKQIDQGRTRLPLKICGDSVIGLNTTRSRVDIDLSDLGGYTLGVSRRHLLIRPTLSGLYVIDLQSTNGTHVNGYPISASQAYRLNDGDLLSLGRLFLGVEIASKSSQTGLLG